MCHTFQRSLVVGIVLGHRGHGLPFVMDEMQDGSYGGSPANWYPDPYGRHEFRFFDGTNWTEDVSSHGRQGIDAVTANDIKTVAGTNAPHRVSKQVDRAIADGERRHAPLTPDYVASDGLLDRQTMVVNQKRKLIEVNSEYAIYGHAGDQIGSVRQVGQSTAKKIFRFLGNLDQYFTHKLQVVDAGNNVLLQLTRPAKFIKSRILVADANGTSVGAIVQENVMFKIRFRIQDAAGNPLGQIRAENWRAWNFSIVDASGVEIARITKTFEGVLTTLFTTADNYVVNVHRQLDDPLRQLVFAAALSIDTALKQDARGIGPASLLDIFGT